MTSDFATKLKIMINLHDFKKAVMNGDIDDYAPYIAHTPGVTEPSNDVYNRRKWLISEGIAIEQIAETATEDEQVQLINSQQATNHYRKWLTSNGHVRRCLAYEGHFLDELIRDREDSVRCSVVDRDKSYLPKLFRKHITRREWNTIVGVMYAQEHPDIRLLRDLLSREVPQKLFGYTYERIDALRIKLTAMEHKASTIERTMTTKQLYLQGSPMWAKDLSAEDIRSLQWVKEKLAISETDLTLEEVWEQLFEAGELRPLFQIMNRMEDLLEHHK
jgi:hypothetical protein